MFHIIRSSSMDGSISEQICSCTYNQLSNKYSDEDIKTMLKKVEQLERGTISTPSPQTKDFVIAMYDDLGKCTGIE